MPYRFATERQDYSDYASGRVFYNSPGQPAFPVRLASEIFQRCLALRQADGLTGPAVLYDPCCGGAYHLATLAYLHWGEIACIIGSDIDEEILSLAARNLSLLTPAGLEQRIGEIEAMVEQFGKASHAAARQSAVHFSQQLLALTKKHQISSRLFQANAMKSKSVKAGLAGQAVDIIIADVPYGLHSAWQGLNDSAAGERPPLWQMLDSLRLVLSQHTVVAIAADKGQKVSHDRYKRVERFRMGKRQVVILQQS